MFPVAPKDHRNISEDNIQIVNKHIIWKVHIEKDRGWTTEKYLKVGNRFPILMLQILFRWLFAKH